MTDWWVGVIVPILGSGLLLFGITSLINSYNLPHVDVQVVPKVEDTPGTTIMVDNNGGRVAATHLVLSAHIPENTIQGIFSTENYTWVKDPGSFKMLVPRLIQDGGFIIVNTSIPATYTVYTTYDQGSTSSSSSPFPILDILSLIIPIMIGGLFLVLFYVYHTREGRKKKFIEAIKVIRNKLKDNLRETTPFELPSIKQSKKGEKRPVWIPYERDPVEYTLGDSIRDRLIHNPADYLLLNDFYEELSRRNRNIEKNQDEETADQDTLDSNKDCLAIAEQVLKDIDWSKYKGRYFDDSPWQNTDLSIINGI